jgi:hypothetical protein
VYSLGATLYELLTLQPAVEGADKAEILKLIAWEDPTPLRKHDKSIPAELETITLKCLAKEPGDRYATAKEIADDLRWWLGDQTIKAKPPGWRGRVFKWVTRHPATAGLYATLTTVVFVAVVLAFAYQRQQVKQERARAAGERLTRAAALVDALETADIAGVPIIVRELEPLRTEAESLLLDRYAAAPTGSGLRLRLALAILPTDARLVDELLATLPSSSAGEVLVLREALRGYDAQLRVLWQRLADASPSVKLRYAALLSEFVPADDRWQPHAKALIEELVRLNPVELATWLPAITALHRPLTPPLLDTYRSAQARVQSGDLPARDQITEQTRLDLAAILLARSAADQPDVLAELMQIADARHFGAFLAPALKGGHSVFEALKKRHRILNLVSASPRTPRSKFTNGARRTLRLH